MSAPPPLTRPKSKSAIAGTTGAVIAPPRRAPPLPPPPTAVAIEAAVEAAPLPAARAFSPPAGLAIPIVRTISPPQSVPGSLRAPTTRPSKLPARRPDDAEQAAAAAPESEPDVQHRTAHPTAAVYEQLPISAGAFDVVLSDGDLQRSVVPATLPPVVTTAGSPSGEAMWREDSDVDFDLSESRQDATPAVPVTDNHPPVGTARPPLSAAMHLMIDDDEDDDNFSVPAPPVPPPRAAPTSATPVVEPLGTPQPTPRSHPRTPTKRESASFPTTVAETPSALRQLLEGGRGGEEVTAGSNTEQPRPSVFPAESVEAAHTTQSRPDMDFSVEPFEYWYQQEERKREEDRTRAQSRRAGVSIEDTIKRLSRPKVTSKDDGTKVQALPTPSAADYTPQPTAQQTQLAVGNIPTSDRPNETHYYFTVRAFDATHHLALPKKAVFAAIAEALSLHHVGLLSTKSGAFVRWSDAVAEARSPGIAGAVMLQVVSFIEMDEDAARVDLHSAFLSSLAHLLAFSEWVLRCSNRISRHIFFDATEIFEDAFCTV